ncbi:DUF4345 domain-containing protein [Kitasatospora sp. NPDC054795]
MPGIADAGPTVGGFGRFTGAVFAGYGVAWIRAARQAPVPARAVRWLAAVLLLGGLARVLSIVVDGRPHWFQLVLMASNSGSHRCTCGSPTPTPTSGLGAGPGAGPGPGRRRGRGRRAAAGRGSAHRGVVRQVGGEGGPVDGGAGQ